MNWHSGFFRVWIVMSAAWVGTIAWETERSASPVANSILKYLALAITPPLGIAAIAILVWLAGQVMQAVLLRLPRQTTARAVPRNASRHSMS
jgi:hypothetical protein